MKALVLFDIDYTIFDTNSFKKSGLTLYTLYPGVKNVLEKLNNTYTLGILSQGEKEFQIKKLQETGIFELLDKDHIFITQDKHGEMEEILKNLEIEETILVDDKLEILKKAKELHLKTRTVWIKNGPYAMSTTENFIPDFTIQDISNLLEVLHMLPTGIVESPQQREYN